MLRNIHTPGGSRVGTQNLWKTPNGTHQVWQFSIPPGAPAGEAAERRRDNTQSIRNARKKARKEDETGKLARRSLNGRSGNLGLGRDGLFVGESYGFEDRNRAQNTL